MAAKVSTNDLEDSVNIELDGQTSTAGEQYSKPGSTTDGLRQSLVQVNSCPVKNVTVFLDRAEVNRVVDVFVSHRETEVVISGLPSVIYEDSVRVQCRGDATIVEVKYAEKVLKDDKAGKSNSENESKAEVLQSKIEGFEKDKKTVQETLAAQQQRLKVLNGYSERVAQSNQDGDKVVDLMEKKTLENLSTFLEYLFTNTEKISKAMSTTKERVAELDKAINDANAELREITPSTEIGGNKKDRMVSVILEGVTQGDVQLTLSYVVANASWSPVYDLRAFSKDNVLQLLYFGVIRQTTGEDWNEAVVALSTAMPSVGGSAPTVPTQELSVAREVVLKSAALFSSKRAKSKRASDGMLASASNASKSLMRGMFSGDDSDTVEESYSSMPAAMVSEGVTSTCFEILRPSTIKSDNSEHKVSISLIELTPEFEYEVSPKLVAHAFLKASVKNDSEYALLAGPANVFLDNNFLAKSFLSAVSPAEKFHVSLGADPSVKVTYHPTKKFQHNTGIFTKSVKLSYEQKITINNTKGKPVTVRVVDQLPKSTHEKIKVHLTEPDIPPPPSKHVEPRPIPPVQINDKNNIEWFAKLDAGAEKDLAFSYTVEYPLGMVVIGL